MSRPLGGYIGYDAEPATAAAPGIWTLREAELYQRKAQWPVLAFTPASLSGLQAWYDASDASTITESSGDVSQIDDKSGNDYHLTQATAALKPTYDTAAQNGLNVLDLAATGALDSENRQTLASSTAGLLSVVASDYTFITLAQPSTDSQRFDFHFVEGSGATLQLARFNDSQDFRLLFRDDSSNSEDVTSAGSLWSQGEWYIMTVTVSGTSVTVFQDNVSRITGDLTGVGRSFTQYSLGRTVETGNSIKVAEQLVYDSALSTEDRTAVHSYLESKWGLA